MAVRARWIQECADFVYQPGPEGLMEAFPAAEPWKRWGAFLIDIVIVCVLNSILLAIASIYYHIKLNVANPNHMLMSITTLLFISWGYFAIAESSQRQATLGKRVLGIIVTDSEGKQISLINATKRFWVKVISSLLFYALVMKNRALHDEFAGSLVINKEALAANKSGKAPKKSRVCHGRQPVP
jgi:uncharacterized RDD family membrane protein YckC